MTLYFLSKVKSPTKRVLSDLPFEKILLWTGIAQFPIGTLGQKCPGLVPEKGKVTGRHRLN